MTGIRRSLGMSLLVSLRRNLSVLSVISQVTLLLAILIRRNLARKRRSNQLNKNALYLRLVLAADLALNYLRLREIQRTPVTL